MDLKQYEQIKFSMAEILRSAEAIDSKDQELVSASRDLLMRLADDRFNLMLVGRFNRGKSTLINAILGAAHLPTGILPLTSVITTVRYGSRKQVVLNFSGGGLRREVPLSKLAEYVTQQSNPGNVKKVAYAEIELPVELLRRGLFFVDSPGLGSSIFENTQTTERFFPEADAFVLITSYDSPLSDEEDRALRRIRTANKMLFVIVNKQDTVNESERGQILEFVKERLTQYSFSQIPHVFSISARQGLEAKVQHDDDLVATSGILDFEKELLRFLTEERAEAFLANMHDRIAALLVRRHRMEEQIQRKEAYQTLLDRLGELQPSERERVTIDQDHSDDRADSHVTLEFDRRSGCRICGEVLDAVLHFLSKYQYELTINPQVQQEHAKRGGFCGLHTWQYENISSPFGVCAAYPELGHRLAAKIVELAHRTQKNGWLIKNLDRLLASRNTCRVCQVRIDAEQKAIDSATTNLRQMTASATNTLPACCLPHLAMIVKNLGQGPAAKITLLAHGELLERIAEDAQRYALRHAALRRHLTSEEERRAAQLMLIMVAGHRSLCAPWQVEELF